jgi:hypothetical protein
VRHAVLSGLERNEGTLAVVEGGEAEEESRHTMPRPTVKRSGQE